MEYYRVGRSLVVVANLFARQKQPKTLLGLESKVYV